MGGRFSSSHCESRSAARSPHCREQLSECRLSALRSIWGFRNSPTVVGVGASHPTSSQRSRGLFVCRAPRCSSHFGRCRFSRCERIPVLCPCPTQVPVGAAPRGLRRRAAATLGPLRRLQAGITEMRRPHCEGTGRVLHLEAVCIAGGCREPCQPPCPAPHDARALVGGGAAAPRSLRAVNHAFHRLEWLRIYESQMGWLPACW